MPISYDYKR